VTAPPPSNVVAKATASASSSGRITVRWREAPWITEYRVFRSTTFGGPYTHVGTVTSTSFTDTGLTPYATYFYQIRAR
jgi:fibronectin type 3 domain-containing protein